MPRHNRIGLALLSTALIALQLPDEAGADDIKIRVLDASITMAFPDPTVADQRRLDAARTMIIEEWKAWLEGGYPPSNFVVLVFDREVWQVKNAEELLKVEPRLKGGGKELFNEALELAVRRAWVETRGKLPRRTEIFYYTDADLELDHDTLDRLATAVVGAKTTDDKQKFFVDYDALMKSGLVELYFMVLQRGLKSDQRSTLYGLRSKILGGPAPVRHVQWHFERWLAEQQLCLAEGERSGLVAPYELPPLPLRIVTLPGYTTEEGKIEFRASVGEHEIDLSPSLVHCWRGQAELGLSLGKGTILPEGLSSMNIRGTPVEFSPAEVRQGKQPVAGEQVLPDCVRVTYVQSQVHAPAPPTMGVFAGKSARRPFSWQIAHPQTLARRRASLPIECSLEVTPPPADGAFELTVGDTKSVIRWPDPGLVRWEPEDTSEEIAVRVTKAPTEEGMYKLRLILRGCLFEGGETQSTPVQLRVEGDGQPSGVEVSQATKRVSAFPGVPVEFDAFSVRLADSRARGGVLLVGPVRQADGIQWTTLVTPSAEHELSKAARIQVPEKVDEEVTCRLRVQVPRDGCMPLQPLFVPLKFLDSESQSGTVNGAPQDDLEFQILTQLPKATVSLGKCDPVLPGAEAELAEVAISPVDAEAEGRYIVFGRVPQAEGLESLRLVGAGQESDLLADGAQVAIPAKGSSKRLVLQARVPREGYRPEAPITIKVTGMGVLVNDRPADDLKAVIRIPADVTVSSGRPPTQPIYETDEKTFAAFVISPTNPGGGGKEVSVSAVGATPAIRSAVIEGVDILRAPALVRVPAKPGELLEVPITVTAADKLSARAATLRLAIRGQGVLVNGAADCEVPLPMAFGQRLPEFKISGCPAFPKVVLFGCPSLSRVPVTVAPMRAPDGTATVHVRAVSSDLPAGSDVALVMPDREVMLPGAVSLTGEAEEWTLRVLLPVDATAVPGEVSDHSFRLAVERKESGFALKGWEAQPAGAVRSPLIQLRAAKPVLVLRNEKAGFLDALEVRLAKGQAKGRSQDFSLRLMPELDALDRDAVDRSLDTVEIQALAKPLSPNERCALAVVDANGREVAGRLHTWLTSGSSMFVEMDASDRENRVRSIPFEARIGVRQGDRGTGVLAPAVVKGTARVVVGEVGNWWIFLLVLAALAGAAVFVWKLWPMITSGGSLEGARVELEDGASVILTGRRAVIGRERGDVRLDFDDVAHRHAMIVATGEEGRALLMAKAGEPYQTSVSGGRPVGPEGEEIYDGAEFSVGTHRLIFRWPELRSAGEGIGDASRAPTAGGESDDLTL